MRKIVEFWLTRMDTHPEEFYQHRRSGVKHNWMQEIKEYKKFLTPEEEEAVMSKLGNINLDRALEIITNRLLEPSDERVEITAWGAAPVKADGNAVANAMMQQRYQVEQLKAVLAAEKQRMEHHVKTSIFDREY